MLDAIRNRIRQAGRSPRVDLERQAQSPVVKAGIAALEQVAGSTLTGVGHSDDGLMLLLSNQLEGRAQRQALMKSMRATWAASTQGTEWARLPLVFEWRGPSVAH